MHKVFSGNKLNLPEGTLCWSHPLGFCVSLSPIELCSAQLKTTQAYGISAKEGTASIDLEDDMVRVLLSNGESYLTKKCYLFAGAQNKELFEQSLQRSTDNSGIAIPEFENTYITAISTM